jgi:hypothetical protein
MALSRAEQRAIVAADAERRRAREIDEYLQLHGSSEASESYDPRLTALPCQTSGVGVVYPPRRVRVSEDSWTRGMRGRTVGVAPGTEDSATEATVRVIHADGSSEIRTASSFRAVRETQRRRHAERASHEAPLHSDIQLMQNMGTQADVD